MKLARALLVPVALVAFGAALLASASVAATRPDDRAGVLGVGAPTVTPAAAHPDNRPGIRGVGMLLASAAAAHPDSRAGIRGVGAQPLSPAAAHPDNRSGVRGAMPVAAEPNGTDWTTIGIGVGIGVAVLSILVAAAFTIRHGGHHPHRPILGH
jgi:hypothetical protein